MNVSDVLPLVAMGGVGLLFLLARVDARDMRGSTNARAAILTLVVAVFAACCMAGAGTAIQIARIGLAGTPPPTMFGAVARIVGVAIAIALWPLARRHTERAALLTFVIGAGASGLIGLGLHASILDAARALYHLLMFACGAILAATFAATFAKRLQ